MGVLITGNNLDSESGQCRFESYAPNHLKGNIMYLFLVPLFICILFMIVATYLVVERDEPGYAILFFPAIAFGFITCQFAYKMLQ